MGDIQTDAEDSDLSHGPWLPPDAILGSKDAETVAMATAPAAAAVTGLEWEQTATCDGDQDVQDPCTHSEIPSDAVNTDTEVEDCDDNNVNPHTNLTNYTDTDDSQDSRSLLHDTESQCNHENTKDINCDAEDYVSPANGDFLPSDDNTSNTIVETQDNHSIEQCDTTDNTDTAHTTDNACVPESVTEIPPAKESIENSDVTDLSAASSLEGSLPPKSPSFSPESPKKEKTPELQLTIRRNNRPKGRESILQRLTDSLLAKKERDYKAKVFSDSDSNCTASPMHCSDSNDSFTLMEPSIKDTDKMANPMSVYDKFSDTDSSNQASPAPLPPRDLNESGPRKPNIRWNVNRVKQLRNVISNILDREGAGGQRFTPSPPEPTPVASKQIPNIDNRDKLLNGDSHEAKFPTFKGMSKRRKAVPSKHPKPLNATRGIIRCKFCPFSKEMGIGAKSAVQRHEKCHYSQGPFTCKICTFSTNNWNSIKMHRQLHVNHGDCMPGEDIITRNFSRRGKQVAKGKKSKSRQEDLDEVNHNMFQRALTSGLHNTRLYSNQAVYPGDDQMLDILQQGVLESPKMPNLARITGSPSSSPHGSQSPAPCLTPPHQQSPMAHNHSSHASHAVDLTTQALDLTSPALDLSTHPSDLSAYSNDLSANSEIMEGTLDLSIPRQDPHPMDLTVKPVQGCSPLPKVSSTYDHVTSAFDMDRISYADNHTNDLIEDEPDESWVTDKSAMSPTPELNSLLNGNITSPVSDTQISPTAKFEDDRYQAKCDFCPFESKGHKAARAIVMKHKTCHYANKRYKCEICKFSSDTVEIMRTHILLHPPEERNVLRNGVSIGGVIHPLRKRMKPGRKKQGAKLGMKKAKYVKPISVIAPENVIDVNKVSDKCEEVIAAVPKKRGRKRKIPIVEPETVETPTEAPGVSQTPTTPDTPTKSPGPPAGTRAANIISEAAIRKVSPPPKKRFMEKVVAEMELAEKNAKFSEKFENDYVNSTSNDQELMSSQVEAAQTDPSTLNIVQTKSPAKKRGRKPKIKPDMVPLSDIDEYLKSENDTSMDQDSIMDMSLDGIIEGNSRISVTSYEDYLKGFQKFNILHCKYCPFKTTGRSHGAKHNLAKHEKCHGIFGRYICEVCSFATKYMDSYKKHKMLHDESPNYVPLNSPPPQMAGLKTLTFTKKPGPKRKLGASVVSKKSGIKAVKKAVKYASKLAIDAAEPAPLIQPPSPAKPVSPVQTVTDLLEKTKRRKGIHFSKTPLKKFNLTCRYCPFQTGANYAAKYNLLRHEKAHFLKSTYTCDQCTFSTAEYRKFKGHLLLHVGIGETLQFPMPVKRRGRKKKIHTTDVVTIPLVKEEVVNDGATVKEELLGIDAVSTGPNAEGPRTSEPVKEAALKPNKLRTLSIISTRRASREISEKQATIVKDTVLESQVKADNVKIRGKQNIRVLTNSDTKEVSILEMSLQESPMKDKLDGEITHMKTPGVSLLQKARRSKNINKSLILSCKFCPFKTCGTSAAARYNLKLHEDCHFRDSTYRCELCSFTTKKFIVIKKHKTLHAEYLNGTVNPNGNLRCGECEFEGENEIALETHVTECHPSQKLDQEARLADTPPAMPSPEMKTEANDGPIQNGIKSTHTSLAQAPVPTQDKQSKRMLEIPAELWYDPTTLLYQCQWCDFTSKREHFFKVHLYCHQRKNVKFRCEGCGYGATRQGFLDHHYREHHKEQVKYKVWASKEERAAVLKPKDLYVAVTERLKLKGMSESFIQSYSPTKNNNKGKTPFLVPAVPPAKQPSPPAQFKRPPKPSSTSPRSKKRRYHPIPAHAANPTGPEQRYLCSLCPFSTTSSEVHNNHHLKHVRPDQFSCPYCTYNTRTRVYLEKHIKLHFTASLQDEALTMLPLDFTKNLVRSQSKPIDNWELDTSNLAKAKRQTNNLPKKQCRFCDRMVPVDEFATHEDRHLIGCAYLKFIDCGSPKAQCENTDM